MATLTTHVLDTARGIPAAGLSVGLFKLDGERELVNVAVTDAEGRTGAPLATDLQPGDYELAFAVMDYFALENITTFYDEIPIRFRVSDAAAHYHVPLLLSPWGYSTYRGSAAPPK